MVSVSSVAKSICPLQRSGEIGLACQEADPLVSMAHHVSHHRRKHLPVLDSDTVEGDIGKTINHHRRNTLFAQVGQRAVVETARGRDDDPVDASLVKGRDHFEPPRGSRLNVGSLSGRLCFHDLCTGGPASSASGGAGFIVRCLEHIAMVGHVPGDCIDHRLNTRHATEIGVTDEP